MSTAMHFLYAWMAIMAVLAVKHFVEALIDAHHFEPPPPPLTRRGAFRLGVIWTCGGLYVGFGLWMLWSVTHG